MAITFEVALLPVFGRLPVFGGGTLVVVVGWAVVGVTVVDDPLTAVVDVESAVVVVV